MFTQKISMDCTKEQYEKYLKAELEKMGYKGRGCYWGYEPSIFTNAANGNAGGMLDIEDCDINKYNRTYLGKFNAPLLLALAAMTDKVKGNYGEWYYSSLGFIRWTPLAGGFGAYHKASVEEIKAHFTQADKLNAEPQRPISKGSVTFDVKLDTTGLEEQLDQFSKRFEAKIKEETLLAYLDKVIKDLEEMLKANPKYNEPIVGEMAIFWDYNKNEAVTAINSENEHSYVNDYPYQANDGTIYMHAIPYESAEQYKSFLKS